MRWVKRSTCGILIWCMCNRIHCLNKFLKLKGRLLYLKNGSSWLQYVDATIHIPNQHDAPKDQPFKISATLWLFACVVYGCHCKSLLSVLQCIILHFEHYYWLVIIQWWNIQMQMWGPLPLHLFNHFLLLNINTLIWLSLQVITQCTSMHCILNTIYQGMWNTWSDP